MHSFGSCPDKPPLAPGSEVEVGVDDKGFHGSWFEAVAKGFAPANGTRTSACYTAFYGPLVFEDGSTSLRPRPPLPFEEEIRVLVSLEIVEAFRKNRW
ncbi:hypothetical protein E2562_036107 [Oryza meyeriana var. granulata]|uniref:Agenet-like domain-containing protein n=1 Tax=Oryza meyeriana var. granulata TaxID=110450 RepID=A0A6G1DT78_9ORYZ|nr:hypothetical protein E2562_036107 [Oryza meyeriana var. granulata]